MTFDREQLEALGFVETSPGNWAKKAAAVGPVPPSKPEPDRREPREDSRREEGGKGSVVKGTTRTPRPRPIGRVQLTAYRNRELEDDNLSASFKALRDAIADSLLPGLPAGQADAWFRWEYGQAETRGEEGVVVMISVDNACRTS